MKQTHKCLYVMRLTTSPPSEDRASFSKSEFGDLDLTQAGDWDEDDERLRSLRVFIGYAHQVIRSIKVWTSFEAVANFNTDQIARFLGIREYPGDPSKSNRRYPDLVFSFEYYQKKSLRIAHINSEDNTLREVDSNLKNRGYWCISFNEYDVLFVQMVGINLYKNGTFLKAVPKSTLMDRTRHSAILAYPFVYFEDCEALCKLNVSNENLQIEPIINRDIHEFTIFNGELVFTKRKAKTIQYLNRGPAELPPLKGKEVWGAMECSKNYLLVSASDTTSKAYTNSFFLFDKELQLLDQLTLSCDINQWVRRLFGTDFKNHIFFLSCRWYYMVDLLAVNKFGKLVLCKSMKASDTSIETAVQVTPNEWLMAGYSQENLIRLKIGWNSLS